MPPAPRLAPPSGGGGPLGPLAPPSGALLFPSGGGGGGAPAPVPGADPPAPAPAVGPVGV